MQNIGIQKNNIINGSESPNLLREILDKNENNPNGLPIKITSMNLFDSANGYIDCRRMYYAYFGTIPNSKAISGIDYLRLIKWIESEYSGQILKKHSREQFYRKTHKMDYVNVIYILKNGLLINIETEWGYCSVLFPSELEKEAQNLIYKIKKFSKRISRFYLAVFDYSDTGLMELKSKKPKLVMHENYNDDLLLLHKDIISCLRKKNKCGLLLFHGKPGTGKSTYISYLIHYVNKKAIYLSRELTQRLDSPQFGKLLNNNPNSILIIEDAEDFLISREIEKNSVISMLLNLTDGILGNSLGIQVICSFNSPINQIDKALLRKGRLIALYKFEELKKEKSKVLLEKLGVENYEVTEPMTLAEIYNTKEKNYERELNKKKPIGFIMRGEGK